MSIGMAADAAVANTHLGCYRDALIQLAGCIERLQRINPEAALNNAYVHRIVLSTILWVQTKITGEIKTIASGEPVEMPIGACSNPEPPEAIRTLPLGPLEIAWYISKMRSRSRRRRRYRPHAQHPSWRAYDSSAGNVRPL
jgi:hypothetical protein